MQIQDPAMEEQRVGLFLCMRCHTMEEIDNYIPSQADLDPRIDALTQVHVRRHPSVEGRLITEWAALGSVPAKAWQDKEYKQQIKSKILEGTGQTGLDPEAYAVKDTFREDAGHCYNRHNRPTFTGVKCLDYMDHSKEIKPDTRAERKAEGMASYDDARKRSGLRKMYLCSYCPYHMSVSTELDARNIK